jgi:hypothetical protein
VLPVRGSAFTAYGLEMKNMVLTVAGGTSITFSRELKVGIPRKTISFYRVLHVTSRKTAPSFRIS